MHEETKVINPEMQNEKELKWVNVCPILLSVCSRVSNPIQDEM